jgi:copper resistance protein C
MNKGLSALGVALVVGAWVNIAQAHTHLKKTVPAAGSTVAATLSEIRLQFDEAIEARLSKVKIESKAGVVLVTEPVAGDPADKSTLIVKLSQPLAAGSYKVNWQAISADTHKVKGSFTFHVRP